MSSRRKIQDATGVDTTLPNVGHLQVWGRGAPLSGSKGFAPGCIYHNIDRDSGQCLWVNVGLFGLSVWVSIDEQVGGNPYAPVPVNFRHTYDLTSLGAKYFSLPFLPAGTIIRQLFLQIVEDIVTGGTTVKLAMGDHAGSPVLGTGYPLTGDLLKNTVSIKSFNGDPLASDTYVDVCGVVTNGSALGNSNLTGGMVAAGVSAWMMPTLPVVV